MSESIIFHYPEYIPPILKSGSQVRPVQMISAFTDLGYHVYCVVGYAKDRKESIEHILSDVEKGVKVRFVYSESSTTPTLLTERHHLPVYPFLDFHFLSRLKKKGIPIGLYYRDVHWRFRQYALPLHKRMYTFFFYWYDWIRYQTIVDHLFLPSISMLQALPTSWPDDRVSPLPPGVMILNEDNNKQKQVRSNDNMLRLFYVGGIVPLLYDLRPMVESVKNLDATRLTVCCLPEQWEQYHSYYSIEGFPNIQVVHASGEQLVEHYSNADLFVFFHQPHPYLNFAMPVKIFETLGHGLPLVVTSGTDVASFVQQEGLGWAVSSQDEFKDLMVYLNQNRDVLEQKRIRVREVRWDHTWLKRAESVANILCK